MRLLSLASDRLCCRIWRMRDGEYDPVTLEILWERLVTIVDEGAVSLRNTAFSLLVREGNDFAVVLLDPEGNAVAQNRACLPELRGNHSPYREICRAKISQYLAAGGRGNYERSLDICRSCQRPVYRNPDLRRRRGGRLCGKLGPRCRYRWFALTAREGRTCTKRGCGYRLLNSMRPEKPNKVLFEMIKENVRLPDQVIGDIESQVSANETAGRKLKELLAGIQNKRPHFPGGSHPIPFGIRHA